MEVTEDIVPRLYLALLFPGGQGGVLFDNSLCSVIKSSATWFFLSGSIGRKRGCNQVVEL